MLVAKYLYKYKGCKPKIALKELLEIDFIRKNFSKTTLYNYFIGAKRYLKTGIRNIITEEICKCLDELNDTPKPLLKKEKSIEEKIKELNDTQEKLKLNYEIQSNKLREKIKHLEIELDYLEQALEIEIDTIEDRKHTLYVDKVTKLLYEGE